MPTSRAPGTSYRWLLDYMPNAHFVTGEGNLRLLLLTDAIFAVLLSLPPVTRATGISAAAASGLIGLHGLWSVVNYTLLRPRVYQREWAFHAAWLGNLLMGVGISCALAAVAGDPKTPLWVLPVMYATMNGATPDFNPSLVLLGVHTLGPLLTIPAFASSGTAWSVGGPLLCAGTSAAVYHLGTMNAAKSRLVRRERDEAVELLQQKEQELARTQLARDLHDSVGSALGLLALHADLVEKSAEDPAQVRRLAQLAREAATDGLGDLRGVLEALTPPGDSLDALAEALHELAHRRAAPSGTQVAITVESGGATALDPAVRLALVRIVQEGLRNAISHGRAKRVELRLEAANDTLRLTLADDGTGFDPATVRKGARGLSGTKARAAELGGALQLDTAPGRGCKLELTLPVRQRKQAAS